jgi:hypothetical protein
MIIEKHLIVLGANLVEQNGLRAVQKSGLAACGNGTTSKLK